VNEPRYKDGDLVVKDGVRLRIVRAIVRDRDKPEGPRFMYEAVYGQDESVTAYIDEKDLVPYQPGLF